MSQKLPQKFVKSELKMRQKLLELGAKNSLFGNANDSDNFSIFSTHLNSHAGLGDSVKA